MASAFGTPTTNKNSASFGPTSVSATLATTTGDLIVVAGISSVGTGTSFSDTIGNSFTPAGIMIQAPAFGQNIYMAYCLSSIGANAGNSFKFDWGGTAGRGSIFVWRVPITAGAIISYDSAALITKSLSNTTGLQTTGTFSTIGTDEISLGVLGCDNPGSVSFSTGSGYSLAQAVFGEGQFDQMWAQFIQFASPQTNITSTFTANSAATSYGYKLASFKALTTHSISGSAGAVGATVAYSGTASGSVVSDASANYSITGLSDGSYTITPSLAGHTFSPTNSAQTVAGANITGVNFTTAPLISALTYTVTDTTIVATWTTDVFSDSNLTAGGKTAIDNGIAANSTSHQCIVTGLKPNTLYSCIVTSGGVSSTPQDVTTNPAQNRIPILSAATSTPVVFGPPTGGDSLYTFVSSDGVTYLTMNDGHGLAAGSNGGANQQLCKFTNTSTLAGANVNIMSSYLGLDTRTGTDGPSGAAMRAANYGPFGINGHLYMFLSRNNQGGPPAANWYGNVIMDNADHGATWNKFTVPGTFNANGLGPCDGATNADIFQYDNSHYGFIAPILYAADDGTLGYNTAGNQIDGANAFVYATWRNDSDGTKLYILRWPRISFAAQSNSTIQYWVGPGSPTTTDFVNDSNWSSSSASATSMHTTVSSMMGGRVFFVPGINRYVLLDNFQTAVSDTDFYAYEGPTPAGPWTQFFTQKNTPQGWIVPSLMHTDLAANTATDNISLRMLYAGAFNVTNYYLPRASALVLRTTPQPTAAFVQGNGDTSANSGTTHPLAFSGNVTSGNLIVVAGRSTVTLASVTDNLGDSVSWNVVYSTSDGGGGTFGWWAWKFAGASAACTVTAHFGSSAAGIVMALGEWSGVNAFRSAPAGHQVLANTTGTSNTVTAVQNDLLIGIGEQDTGGTSPIGAGGGYTLRAQARATTFTFAMLEDLIVSAAGTFTAISVGWGGGGHGVYGIGAFYNNTFTPGEFSISGSAGKAGATVSYSGTASGSVTADASGNYTIPNLYAGSYTITPTLASYSFSPANSAQTVTNANITGVNFTATKSSSGSGTSGAGFAALSGLTDLLVRQI